MLRIRNLSNQYVKRHLRPLYAHTQATAYACTLDASLRNVDGSFRAPLSTDTLPIARSANAYTYQGGLLPGTVMLKAAGEGVVVHPGGNTALRPFGLLAQFVGGTIDDLQDNNEVACWQGVNSVWELLAPAFDDTGLAAAYAAATPGSPVRLFAGTDGRLTATNPGSNAPVVAYLVERTSAAKITIQLNI